MKKNQILFNTKEIQKILPHRYPFLFVDRVISMNLESGEIIGQKNFSINEHFFQGHFPFSPIVPGVLIIEAMAQTGGILVHQKGYKENIAVLLNIANAKFRNPVLPGDVMYIHVKALHISSKGGKMQAQAKVKEKIAVEAELSFALVAKKEYFAEKNSQN